MLVVKKYTFLISLNLFLIGVISIALNIVIDEHRSSLIESLKEKTRFIALSIENELKVDLLFGDVSSLQKKALSYKRIDVSLDIIGFYNQNKVKLTGNSEYSVVEFNKESFVSVSDVKNNRLVIYHLIKGQDQSIIGYACYGYSLDGINAVAFQLLIKIFLVSLSSLLLINVALVWAIREIERKSIVESAIRIENVTAHQKNVLQKSFLANMSHELRTPLNAISGFGQMLSDKKMDKQAKYWLNLIKEATSSMSFLVNDILDFSKIENNEIEFENESFDFVDLFKTTCQILEPKVKDSIYFDYSFNLHEKLIVIGDYNRVKQVLVNLLSNAIKYTDKGEIKTFFRFLVDNDEVQIDLRVIDTGIGIPSDKKPYIFRPFKQAHENKDRNLEGTGLGLAITKELVGRMGGKIDFKSTEGVGSEFYVKFKFGMGDVESYKSSEMRFNGKSSYYTQCNILVAEDNKLNQILITTILEKWGAKVTIANNGKEALEATLLNKFDVLLMDIQMPLLGGIEATKAIRKTGNEMPIIALTANALKGDAEEYLKAGMNGYVSKPIKKLLLAKEMQKFIDLKIEYHSSSINDLASADALETASVNDTESLVINLKKVEDIIGKDSQKTNKLLELFLISIEEDIKVMHQLFVDSKFEIIRAKAHKIKPQIDFLCNEFDLKIVKEIEDCDMSLTELELKVKIDLFIKRMLQYKKSAENILTKEWNSYF